MLPVCHIRLFVGVLDSGNLMPFNFYFYSLTSGTQSRFDPTYSWRSCIFAGGPLLNGEYEWQDPKSEEEMWVEHNNSGVVASWLTWGSYRVLLRQGEEFLWLFQVNICAVISTCLTFIYIYTYIYIYIYSSCAQHMCTKNKIAVFMNKPVSHFQ